MKTVLFSIIFILVYSISYCFEDTNSVMSWSSLGTGMNGNVHSLTIYNGNIVAGGEFTLAGGITANRIAKWNGTSWSALGLGVNGNVLALTVFNGELIAGGEFTTAGGISALRIAKWDGNNWASLNSGMDSTSDKVMALIEHDGALIVGGQFELDTVANANLRAQLNNIAKWTGTNWSNLGTGLNSLVTSLTIYEGEIVAGGKFDGKVKVWDGIVWSTLGSGLNNTVNALGEFDNLLIAGGEFTGHVSRWDGNNWSFLGGGVENNVWAITSYQNAIIVGGDFRYAGPSIDSLFVNRIAKWDGNSWSGLMNGMNDRIKSFTLHDTVGLITGGVFTTAGGFTANRIADWNMLETFSVSGEVRYTSSQPVTGGKVRAVRLDYYTYEIIVVDSANIQINGSYILTRVPPIPVDLISVANDEEEDFIPTYYPSTIFWENAIRVTPDSNLVNVNIIVEPISGSDNLLNPGTIGGHVFLNYLPSGYTHGNGMNFKSGAIVYAKIGNSYKGYDISNRFEEYRVDSIPAGSYDIIVNRLGYTSAFANVTLNYANSYTIDSLDFTLDTTTVGIQKISSEVPDNYELHQNYPNPFNPETNISFSIPLSTEVSLRIFNILGQEVVKLINNEYLTRGSYNVHFTMENLPSGVYFYRLETFEFAKAKKMLLIK